MFGSKRCRDGRSGNRRGNRHGIGARFDPDRVEAAISFMASHLGILDRQIEVWERFSEAVRSGAGGLRDADELVPTPGDTPTAPARLAKIEAVATAGVDALRQVRPAFESLYVALDLEQRERLERLTGDRDFAHD